MAAAPSAWSVPDSPERVPAGNFTLADFTLQLTAPDHVFDVRPRRPLLPTDHTRAGHAQAGHARAGHSAPCVVLLSRSCDAELDSVQGLLEAGGIASARLNADELASSSLLVDPGSRTACLNGRWLVPTVTWARHFSARAIEGTGDAARDMFLRDSWRAAARLLTAIAGTAIRSRGPGPLSQLLLAQRCQVEVPRTIVTTDLSRARAAFACPRLVIKAARHHFVESVPGELRGIFPAIVERLALSGAACLGPPVLVQEYLQHEAELRVYYVQGQLHAFTISKDSPADPWTRASSVGVRHAVPSPAVAAATGKLASAMSLRYGAFDFLIRDGKPVFLEVNLDGDWRWAERKAGGCAVTLSVARMLSRLHHRSRRASPVGARAGSSPELLTFLTARPSATA